MKIPIKKLLKGDREIKMGCEDDINRRGAEGLGCA